MAVSLQTLASYGARRILRQISLSQAPEPVFEGRDDPFDEPEQLVRIYARPIAENSHLSNGNILITPSEETQTLAVLTIQQQALVHGKLIASVSFLLPDTLSIEDFTKQTYRAILRREADLEGWELYTNLLREKKISRTRFVQILLASTEAQNLPFRQIIIPISTLLKEVDIEAVSCGNLFEFMASGEG